MNKIKKIPSLCAIGIIRIYKKYISPLTKPSCRYIPTCSEYSLIAFQKYGFRTGLKLTVKRILRCNPLGSYGFDPVPDLPVKPSNKKRI